MSGAPISPGARPADLKPSGAGAAGERRQVTVLFTDMVGFTTISERLGEEGTYALIQPIYELMAGAVKEQGGSVKDFTGDGIMALFGVPAALEDAPLRACRAALSIQERIAAAGDAIESQHGVRPQMRIGINTGPVVVAQVRDGTSVTALGDAVNLASRLQTLAEPGKVLLSEATHRLVQGLVEAAFAGAHAIKGKAEPQKVYRLDALRQGAARFDAALSRGLTAYVGRDQELEALERGLEAIGSGIQVIDLVGEPGIGKSRLVHEFRAQLARERAHVLSGSCSPDGQQTPFLAFIEVVRGAFQVSAGEAEWAVAEKLAEGLKTLGLDSAQNRGLLLNLLGLKVPEDALTGLDGVLVGLRTRELLQQLLEARCRLTPVVMLFEDLHWIDSVSEELLAKIAASDEPLRLLIIHTRRPEYQPPWAGQPRVTTLPLEPLTARETSRIVEARLGVETLPEALAKLVAEKAEGNALFAEEIASFLLERGVVRKTEAGLEFDAAAVAAALPTSVQALLTARIDRLAPEDRKLLQAASVIGRRFESELLAAVAGATSSGVEGRLAALATLDLVHRDEKAGDHVFKHALGRDALYDSLLSAPRRALHLRIAEEIERRSGNRLAEVAEALAHHYSQTERTDKAFAYLAMAGAKSLGVYSLDEARSHFSSAIALLDKYPDCAGDQEVANFLVNYSLLLNLLYDVRELSAVVGRYRARLDGLGDDRRAILARHHEVFALIIMGRYREAAAAQDELAPMAARLGDDLSKAYSAAGAIFVSRSIWPMPVERNEAIGQEALLAAARTNDLYIQSWLRWVIAFDAVQSGSMGRARLSAQELMTIGRASSDPRSIGFGLSLLAWTENILENYPEAIRYSDEALEVALTPWDRISATSAKAMSLVMLQQPEGISILNEHRLTCRANGWYYQLAALDLAHAVSLVLQGHVRHGLLLIEQLILEREREGFQLLAEWYRGFVCQIYLEIILGTEKPPLLVLARNLPILIWIKIFGPSRIRTLMARIRPFFSSTADPNGCFIANFEMILGLLDKAQRKPAPAIQHLTEAKRIAAQFGQTPMLARIDAALAELS
jgi:class 3 adenylate cyclase